MNPSGLKQLLGLLLLVSLPFSVFAKDFKEGVEYSRLAPVVSTSSGDKIEIVEFFWYGCPHCYQFEPTLDKWLKNKPDNVHFIRIPAPLNPSWIPHTKAYYALEMMGVGEKHHMALFKAIHEKRQRIFNFDAIASFLEKAGVDKQAFTSSYNSFAVEMRTRKAMQMSKQYKLEGVPLVAVNGKYTVSPTQTKGYQGMIDVTNYLIEKEAKTAN